MCKKKCNDMKEEIKNLETLSIYRRLEPASKTMLSYCLKCRKNTESENAKVATRKKWKNNGFIKISSVWQ